MNEGPTDDDLPHDEWHNYAYLLLRGYPETKTHDLQSRLMLASDV